MKRPNVISIFSNISKCAMFCLLLPGGSEYNEHFTQGPWYYVVYGLPYIHCYQYIYSYNNMIIRLILLTMM